MDSNRLILLGEISAAYGIKGEVRIKSYTVHPEDIATYNPLRDKTGRHQFKIESLRKLKNSIIAKLSGVHDRTAAEKLRKTALYVHRSQLAAPEPGSYYEEDLKGLNALDQNGGKLGKVNGIFNFGAGPLLEIALSTKKETLLIPFIDAFVPEVHLQEGTIIIRPPLFLEEEEDKKK